MRILSADPISRAGLAIAASAMLWCVPATGSTPPAGPVAAEETTTLTVHNHGARMTVGVMVNGQGPFPFAIDTGADRTAISASLVERLGLKTHGVATLHGMAGVDRVRTVRIERLQVGGRQVGEVIAPVLPDGALGVLGLLGIDAVADQKVVMDFARGEMSVHSSAKREPSDPDMIVVRAKRRFGQLVLVDASVNGSRVYAIIDSGSERTIGNSALRRLLAKQSREAVAKRVEMISVTGRTLMADETLLRRMKIGGLTVTNLPIAYSDAHPFRKFGLTDAPAMLLGADMLRAFDRVSLDFESKKVRLFPKDAQ